MAPDAYLQNPYHYIMSSNRQNTQPAASPLRIVVSILAVIISVFLWLSLLGQLMFVVPGRARLFEDFRLQVPELTKLVLAVSHWSVKYWYVATIAMFGFLVAGALLCIVVRHWKPSLWLGALWFLVWIFLPFILHAIVVFSWMGPEQALLEGLGPGPVK